MSAENQNAQATAEPTENVETSLTQESTSQDGGKATLDESSEVKKAEFQPVTEDKTRAVSGSMGLLMDVSLPVTVELGRTTMLIKEVINLGEGAVIQLERSTNEPVDIIVGGRLLGKGEVVVVNGRFGVRITDLINPIEGGKQ